MITSSNRKAGGVVIVADADAAAPALLLLPFWSFGRAKP